MERKYFVKTLNTLCCSKIVMSLRQYILLISTRSIQKDQIHDMIENEIAIQRRIFDSVLIPGSSISIRFREKMLHIAESMTKMCRYNMTSTTIHRIDYFIYACIFNEDVKYIHLNRQNFDQNSKSHLDVLAGLNKVSNLRKMTIGYEVSPTVL